MANIQKILVIIRCLLKSYFLINVKNHKIIDLYNMYVVLI